MDSNMKQAIAVRTDLKMGKGKIAAQVGHACVCATENARESHKEWYHTWSNSGQVKIVLKVQDVKELQRVKKHAAEIGLPYAEITDAGHTQIEPGTVTCVSVGPAPEDLVDRVTGDLKLL